MARVLIQQVSKAYPGVARPAVDGVTIEAADGEFLVLVGPSGCGKSTTLRLVAGLEEATAGDIFIGERRVNTVPPKDRDIAMIFQNYALYPHMSVYQNMAFPLKMRKAPRAEIDARVREAAAMLELTQYLDRKPKALSGGQRQRVAVGRAIVRNPQVFLFDEPLSNLDAKMRVAMRAEITKLHRSLKTTMIYVTHDQVEAMTMGDRIAVMHEGRLQQAGDPKTIYDRPVNQFVAGFMGSPAMNFIPGTIRGEGDTVVFEAAGVRFALPPGCAKPRTGEAVLGIRPEDIADREGRFGDAPPAPVDAEIDALEPLGAETLFHMRTAAGGFIARLDRDAQGRPGETKRLLINLDRIHFFDPATGARM